MKEIRSATLTSNKELTLEGIPIVFDKPTQINDQYGSYTEIIRSEAITDEILQDVKLLYNHDLNRVPLARSQNTMTLTKDRQGVKMVAILDETNKDIYGAVKRGDLNGMSFSFTVPPGGDVYDKNTNTRIINKIDKIYEVSVVPFPAYPQTSVKARAKQNKNRQIEIRNLKIKVNQILKRSV